MALFIVVHHPAAPDPNWANEWEGDTLLKAITTPRAVATRLAQAKAGDERVYVHRCAYGGRSAEICCSGTVASIDAVGKSVALVRFGDVRAEAMTAPIQPHAGQSMYEAPFS